MLYRPGDYVDLAKKMIWMLERPEVARQMGESGRKRVEEIFNKKTLCARIENIYKHLTSKWKKSELYSDLKQQKARDTHI
jgi:glycosyltransferase involved in cell wall biosynthesis